VVHGQSGTGKSIALARLAARTRKTGKAAVHYSSARIPYSAEIDGFCEAAEQSGAVATLLICDCNASIGRYRELLLGLRSRGRRAVVLGSSYRYIDTGGRTTRTLIGAPDALSDLERDQIALLIGQFADDTQPIRIGHDRNVLAVLYRMLPASRHRLSTGLGREARPVEEILRDRGGEKRPREPGTKLAEQLIAAGFAAENEDISRRWEPTCFTPP
jgi:hypothetical protein